jgi:hypothetical protein
MDIYVKKMSQLREHIERHPSETTRLLGLDYDPIIGLITHEENLYNQQKKFKIILKFASSKAEVVAHLN